MEKGLSLRQGSTIYRRAGRTRHKPLGGPDGKRVLNHQPPCAIGLPCDSLLKLTFPRRLPCLEVLLEGGFDPGVPQWVPFEFRQRLELDISGILPKSLRPSHIGRLLLSVVAFDDFTMFIKQGDPIAGLLDNAAQLFFAP